MHTSALMIGQHWFMECLGAIRQQVITWTNIDSGLCHHMVSLGHHLELRLKYCWQPSSIPCWCPSSLHHQAISSNGIDCVMCIFLSSLSFNHLQCASVAEIYFMFPGINSAQGLLAVSNLMKVHVKREVGGRIGGLTHDGGDHVTEGAAVRVGQCRAEQLIKFLFLHVRWWEQRWLQQLLSCQVATWVMV